MKKIKSKEDKLWEAFIVVVLVAFTFPIAMLVLGAVLFPTINIWREGFCNLNAERYWDNEYEQCKNRYAQIPEGL